MSAFEKLKKYLKLGHVYRRGDLAQWSTSIDRHLKQFVAEGTLQKVARGLYYYPTQASFGNVPPEDEVLVRAFLRDDNFLLMSPNLYNSLGVGTTQLYNKCLVYNHKWHGRYTLAGKVFEFRRKQKFPKVLSKEFLLVDLLNNLHELAEDRDAVLQSVKSKMLKASKSKMKRMVNAYAGRRTKVSFNRWLSESRASTVLAE